MKKLFPRQLLCLETFLHHALWFPTFDLAPPLTRRRKKICCAEKTWIFLSTLRIRVLHLKMDCLCIDFNLKSTFQGSAQMSEMIVVSVHQFLQRSLPNLNRWSKLEILSFAQDQDHWDIGSAEKNGQIPWPHTHTSIPQWIWSFRGFPNDWKLYSSVYSLPVSWICFIVSWRLFARGGSLAEFEVNRILYCRLHPIYWILNHKEIFADTDYFVLLRFSFPAAIIENENMTFAQRGVDPSIEMFCMIIINNWLKLGESQYPGNQRSPYQSSLSHFYLHNFLLRHL